MGPFDENIFTKSPTVVLPPPPGQLLTPDPSMQSSPLNPTESPSSYANHSTAWNPSSGRPPLQTAPSRKRSRDEGSFELAAADGSYFPSQNVTTPAAIPEEEPIYGEGMTLLNPSTGVSVSAESQTGTWYEEKAETEDHSQPPPPDPSSDDRPMLSTSRKSQRLDSTAPGLDDLAVSALPSSPSKTSSTFPTDPCIDTFTLSLGIGWTRLDASDPAIAAAARGWARYIANHYAPHIHNAEILLKSKGLNAYLVGAQEGFFLFSDDLGEGRLVGRDWEETLAGLRSMPMRFVGEDSLRAERTPGPPESVAAGVAMNGGVMQDGGSGTWSMNGGGGSGGGGMDGVRTNGHDGGGDAGGMELD